jgi:hypothetical protein
MQREYTLFTAIVGRNNRALAMQYYVVEEMTEFNLALSYSVGQNNRFLHNCYGPAFYERDGKRQFVCIKYFTNGFPHRTYGPAEMYFKGDHIYAIYCCHYGKYKYTIADRIKAQITYAGAKYIKWQK